MNVSDLSLFQTSAGPSGSTQDIAGPNGRSSGLFGQAKVMQRFLIELGTRLGSKPGQPDAGCTFFDDLFGGNLRSEFDVRAAFAFAADRIASRLKSVEPASAPDNETFEKATLDSVEIGDRSLTLAVSVTTGSGEVDTSTFSLEF